MLVWFEGRAWLGKDQDYEKIARLFAKLLAITFVIGVATGIVMEFQFGTNWSEYSRFVGDIFGAPLAAEAVFAFFLESSFMGLYLFGRNKISRGAHWFSCLMVALGATISAFWILVANSWMQTPAGFEVVNGRAELTSFAEAVFNDSMWIRFFHTLTACLVCGAFFVTGISAWLVRKNRESKLFRKALVSALVIGFINSVLVAVPFGHHHAQQVAKTQPEKLAAMEGLESTQENAPLLVFGLVNQAERKYFAKVGIPGGLSWLAFGDTKATVQGLDAFPDDEEPPLALTFYSFHLMVVLGGFFIFMTAAGLGMLILKWLWRNKVLDNLYLWGLTLCLPLPVLATQLGWMAAEVGRQPWIVYRVLKTRDAFSPTVPAEHVLFSLIMFSAIYLFLLILYIYLLRQETIKAGKATIAADN